MPRKPQTFLLRNIQCFFQLRSTPTPTVFLWALHERII